MAPKKPFIYFVEVMREKAARKGINYSLTQAMGIFRSDWKKLSEADRKVYKDRARALNQNKPANSYTETKMTSIGKSFAELNKEEAEIHKKRERTKHNVVSLVSLAKSQGIADMPFYFIHFNYYCVVKDGDYIPCEMALVEYTVRDGIRRKYHTFIDGAIPVGYMGAVLEHSKESHEITVPPPEPVEGDYCNLYDKIEHFVKEGLPPDAPFPLLFTYYNNESFHCNRSNEAVVENILERLCFEIGEEETLFEVSSVIDLFFHLYNACCEGTGKKEFSDSSVSQLILEKDKYDNNRGLACNFHEDNDKMKFCSLSLVQRWTFLISDYCCEVLGLPMEPGTHCPKNMQIEHASLQDRSDQQQQQSSSWVSSPHSQFNTGEWTTSKKTRGKMQQVQKSAHRQYSQAPSTHDGQAAALRYSNAVSHGQAAAQQCSQVTPRQPSCEMLAEASKRAIPSGKYSSHVDTNIVTLEKNAEGWKTRGPRKEVHLMAAGRGQDFSLEEDFPQLSISRK